MSVVTAEQHHISTHPPSYTNKVAKGPLLDKVCSLRYTAYREEGYIDKCHSGKFIDKYDSLPNCSSYLTYHGKDVIGSIRSCLFDPNQGIDIPAMEVFRKEISSTLGNGSKLIEANKFVVHPIFQNRGGARARFSIYKNIANEIVMHGAKFLVAAVREEHIKFYKSLFFQVASDPKSYPHLNFKTILLICYDVNKFIDKVVAKSQSIRHQNDTLSNYRTG